MVMIEDDNHRRWTGDGEIGAEKDRDSRAGLE